MRLAEHITTLRAWWLIASLVRRKPGVLRPGFVGMRGQWSYDYVRVDVGWQRRHPLRKLGNQVTDFFRACVFCGDHDGHRARSHCKG